MFFHTDENARWKVLENTQQFGWSSETSCDIISSLKLVVKYGHLGF
jgi:hypothetical protein